MNRPLGPLLRLVREGAVFGAVGVAATLTHVLIALALEGLAGLEALLANLIGYTCGIGVSYFGHARLTFGAPSRNAAQFVRFLAVTLFGLGLNQLIVWACVHRLEWPFWMALVAVVLLVPGPTFLLAKLWAFRRPKV
jgi:putative flippase GtrA